MAAVVAGKARVASEILAAAEKCWGGITRFQSLRLSIDNEMASGLRLAAGFVVRDRNRIELRWIDGVYSDPRVCTDRNGEQ